MFHALHKVDMRACYAKQNINLACPNESQERETTETKHMLQLPIYYILEQDISIGVRALRKKLNIFILQMPIYYILEQDILIGVRALRKKLNIFILQIMIYYILEQDISIGVRALRKKLNIFILQMPIYYILNQEISIGTNANIAKTKLEKQIIFAVEKWIQCLLLWLKSRSARGAFRHAPFMGNCPTISHTWQPYLTCR